MLNECFDVSVKWDGKLYCWKIFRGDRDPNVLRREGNQVTEKGLLIGDYKDTFLFAWMIPFTVADPPPAPAASAVADPPPPTVIVPPSEILYPELNQASDNILESIL